MRACWLNWLVAFASIVTWAELWVRGGYLVHLQASGPIEKFDREHPHVVEGGDQRAGDIAGKGLHRMG